MCKGSFVTLCACFVWSRDFNSFFPFWCQTFGVHFNQDSSSYAALESTTWLFQKNQMVWSFVRVISGMCLRRWFECRCACFAFPLPQLYRSTTIQEWLSWARSFMVPCMWKLMIGLNHHASRIQMALPEVQVLFYNLAYTSVIEINIFLFHLLYSVFSNLWLLILVIQNFQSLGTPIVYIESLIGFLVLNFHNQHNIVYELQNSLLPNYLQFCTTPS